MRKEPEKSTSSRLTEEDLKDGKEFDKAFSSLNETGKMLVSAYMAGLRGQAVLDNTGKKAG